MPMCPFARAVVFAATLAFSAAAEAPQAAALDCEKQIGRTLQELAVPEDAVTSIQVVRRSAGANPASNYTLDAWVRLKSCSKGALVIHMTRYCLVQNVYTTGDCRVGSMPSY